MSLTFNEIILRPLLDRLESKTLIAHTAQDDNGNRRAGGVYLSHRRKTERIRERQVQEHGIKSLTTQKHESFCQCLRTGNLKFLNAPLREKILRKLSVDVIVFDQERFDHLPYSLSR